jgi:DNA polymerase I-like protein with 3'-5' exonuclease and polymerase domains
VSILERQSLALKKHRKLLKAASCDYLLQVHDELIFKVKMRYAEECLNSCATVMAWEHYMPSIWTKRNEGYCIPLVAEGGVGHTWKEAKSKDKHLFHVKIGYDYWRKNQ